MDGGSAMGLGALAIIALYLWLAGRLVEAARNQYITAVIVAVAVILVPTVVEYATLGRTTLTVFLLSAGIWGAAIAVSVGVALVRLLLAKRKSVQQEGSGEGNRSA